ncbi:hypothetical protein RFI_28679 [Reticulomyxa filosa]|uniref:Uncharacterized protein n=1 Tax=Reticulomyxa filosa TaxID=46433 RepID=X6M400_RETFI|nr:hypothetical protein RFI_28679 [Reticulomyxa filosa]|eukprot:ETO08708.1 hypothetical protein RFI_28679 [Reticulomyxa filosa]
MDEQVLLQRLKTPIQKWSLDYLFRDAALRIAIMNWAFSGQFGVTDKKLDHFLSLLFADEYQIKQRDGTYGSWQNLTFEYFRHFWQDERHSTFIKTFRERYCFPYRHSLYSSRTYRRFGGRSHLDRKTIPMIWLMFVTYFFGPLYLLGRLFTPFYPFACVIYYSIVFGSISEINTLQLLLTGLYGLLIFLLVFVVSPNTFWWMWLSWHVLPGRKHPISFFQTDSDAKIITTDLRAAYEMIISYPAKEKVLNDMLGSDVASIVMLYLPRGLHSDTNRARLGYDPLFNDNLID